MAGKTEWEDALIKHGIMPKPVEKPTDDDLTLEKFRSVKSLEEQVDKLNDIDEDDFLEKYRKKRIAELKKQSLLNKFGNVAYITKPEFVKEVTEASKTSWVLCLLFAEGHKKSDLLQNVLVKFASQHRHVKCTKILAKQCVENFPDSDAPLLLVYHKGDLKTSLYKGLHSIKPEHLGILDKIFEYEMGRLKMIECGIEHDPRFEEKSGKRVQYNPMAVCDDI